jgi:hypothetical protein
LWDAIAVVFYTYENFIAFFFSTYFNSWLVFTNRRCLSFGGHGIKCICDQIQNHSSNILRKDIDVADACIIISFRGGIEGFVFCTKTTIS